MPRAISINAQTKLWALSHISIGALAINLGGCATPTVYPEKTYTLCEPVAPATTCGDDTTVEVK